MTYTQESDNSHDSNDDDDNNDGDDDYSSKENSHGMQLFYIFHYFICTDGFSRIINQLESVHGNAVMKPAENPSDYMFHLTQDWDLIPCQNQLSLNLLMLVDIDSSIL